MKGRAEVSSNGRDPITGFLLSFLNPKRKRKEKNGLLNNGAS